MRWDELRIVTEFLIRNSRFSISSSQFKPFHLLVPASIFRIFSSERAEFTRRVLDKKGPESIVSQVESLPGEKV
jgi:hypothetical protein